jgi:hypothetical protein
LALTEHINGEFEVEASGMCNQNVLAEWEYNIDVNNPIKEEALVSIVVFF